MVVRVRWWLGLGGGNDHSEVLNQSVSLCQIYTPLSSGEFQLIRQTLLIFFQDMHIRVMYRMYRLYTILLY